jgi:GMP synthase - Glutamine amidotransferase domain
LQGKILAIQNIECEHLGILKPFFEHDGFSIDTVLASKERLPDSPQGYNALIVLGGPMSVNDPYDYLREEERLILQALNSRMPMLGICLGSQLLAKVINGRVYKGHVKEIGWYTVNLTEYALRTVFRGLDDRLLYSNGITIHMIYQIMLTSLGLLTLATTVIRHSLLTML